MEIWAIVMLVVAMGTLLLGYPVAFTLGAVAFFFGGIFLGLDFFNLLPLRIWGIMTNFTLLAVPLFVFMGVLFEKSGIAVALLETMGELFGKVHGGIGVSIVIVGALLAATTGVVGATVVTMTVIALPVMIKHGYQKELATGTIAAAGTLGQIIPPSIVMVLLGDVVGVPVGRLFMGSVIPGLLLVVLYIIYILVIARLNPQLAPPVNFQGNNLGDSSRQGRLPGFNARIIKSLLPPLLLVFAVLGSIFFGVASPTESAAFGAFGSMLLAAANKRLTLATLRDAMKTTTHMTSMVFLILVGATAFGLVFRGLGGDQLVHDFMTGLPGGVWGFLFVSMFLLFILGFFLDFIEITFVAVPILAPIAVYFGLDPLWFTVLIALNLQTSFLTPPFGFSLFYLQAAAPPEINTLHIYRGIVPFVLIQLFTLMLVIVFPSVATWLPDFVDSMDK